MNNGQFIIQQKLEFYFNRSNKIVTNKIKRVSYQHLKQRHMNTLCLLFIFFVWYNILLFKLLINYILILINIILW